MYRAYYEESTRHIRQTHEVYLGYNSFIFRYVKDAYMRIELHVLMTVYI